MKRQDSKATRPGSRRKGGVSELNDILKIVKLKEKLHDSNLTEKERVKIFSKIVELENSGDIGFSFLIYGMMFLFAFATYVFVTR
ncbi:hypothetical protein [Brevibacillus reuszeri]|uniref:hypothetical protein n=1 Tax=Brevibacillus reuszeri TaxID=54915 RepID=UPI001F180218|nr:hypothetical protein [Brevibacillus reuszeri]